MDLIEVCQSQASAVKINLIIGCSDILHGATYHHEGLISCEDKHLVPSSVAMKKILISLSKGQVGRNTISLLNDLDEQSKGKQRKKRLKR